MASVELNASERLSLDVERHHVALAGVLVVGFALRAWGLGAESLWLDEVYPVQQLQWPLPSYMLTTLSRADPHPPLYYIALDKWVGVAGVSAVGLRSLSTVLDLASMGLVYLVARRLYERRVGLLASALFALSPFYVWYGREARMYALATALTLASVYLLLRMADGDREWYTAFGYVVATLALVHTHAFGPLVVLAQNVYLAGAVLSRVRRDRRLPDRVGDLSVRRWVRLQATVGVASVPYYTLLLHNMFVTERFADNVSWVPPVTIARLWKLAGTYVGRTVPPVEPWGYESLWAYGPANALTVVGELATLAALALAAVALVVSVRDDADGDAVAPGPFLAAWALVPVVTLYALSVFVTPLLYDRFTAMAGVAFLVLVARGLDALVDSRREAAVVGAVTLLVLAVPLAGLHADPHKPQTREAVSIIEADAGEDDLVLVSPGWDFTTQYYLADWDEPPDQPASSDGLPSWEPTVDVAGIETGASVGAVREAADSRETVWLILSFRNDTQRATTVETVRTAGYEVTRQEDLEKVDLYRFERES